MTKEELNNIVGGGTTMSGTLINSFIKVFSFIFDFGKTIGSAIRYKKSGYTC